MKSRRFPLNTRTSIAAGAAMFVLVALMPSVATAATPKCFGKPATKVSNKAEINGTSGNDVIVSRSNAPFTVINGKGGNDLICGGAGADFVYGSDGNDRLKGNGNTDYLAGGPGNDDLYGDKNDGGSLDVADYELATNGVRVNWPQNRATGEGTDTFHANIDGVWGSESADTIIGNNGTNFIWGGNGNDTIEGRAGLDLITPGGGDDTVNGGTDPGVNDLDIYYVQDATGPATVDLENETGSGEGIGTDTVVDFEHIVGSSFDDTLQGDGQSNMLFGGPGNDTLNGRGGFDYASFWFAAGAVNASLQTKSSTGASVADGDGNQIGEGNDTFQELEGLLGTIDHDDNLTGDNQNNYIDGDGGSDSIAAGGGNDWIVGGLGTNESVDGGPGDKDFWDYFGNDALNVNLSTGQITSPSLGTLTITGVEWVAGADQADTFVGDNANNTFFGWGGNDTFTGGGGDDSFDGGLGTDSGDPGDGSDTCFSVESTVAPCEVVTPDPLPVHELATQATAVETLRRNI